MRKPITIIFGLLFLLTITNLGYAYPFLNYGHNALWNETGDCSGNLCATWTGTPPTVEATQKTNGTNGIQLPNAFTFSNTGYSSTNFNFTYFIYVPNTTLGTGIVYLGLRDDTVQGCSGDGKGFSFGYTSGTSTTQWSYCTGGTWTASGISVTAGWHQVDINRQGTNYQFYFDGVSLKNGTDSKLGSYINGYSNIGSTYFDDLHAWNGTITSNGTATDNNTITFVSQNPSDIALSNLFTNHINITYNYTKNNLSEPVYLNYTVTDNTRNCIIYINGTCARANNSIATQPYDSNTTSGSNATLYSFVIDENEILPTTYNLHPEVFANNTLSNLSLLTTAYYVSTEIYNISNAIPYNFLEIDAISVQNTGISRVYACNSSYDFSSQPATSANCNNFGSITTNTFNHTDGNSTHNILTFPIINGSTGTVKITPTMSFMVRGDATGSIVQYIGQTTRTSTTKTSTNNGNLWTNQTYTIDAHLRQFNSGATGTVLVYNGCGNYTAGIPNGTVCSTTRSDNIDVSYLPPSVPTILTPTNATYQQFINITYAPSFPSTNQSISNYTITLLNSDLTTNTTLVTNNNATFSYNWNTYLSNLQTGRDYYIKVTVTDSVGLTAFDLSPAFNFSANGLLNVTIRSIFGNTSINGTITVYNGTIGFNSTINTTTGSALFNITKGYTYTINTNPVNYALGSGITAPSTNSTTVYIYHFTTNSINITAYDQSNLGIISTQPTTVQMVGTYQQYNFTLPNGTGYFDLLAPDVYSVLFSSNGYYSPEYTITVIPQTTQSLNGYLLNSTPATNIQSVFYIYDTTNNPITDANVLVEELINQTFYTIESRITDVTGVARISLDTTKIYRFTFSKSGYVTKTATFQPVSATYTIRLQSTTSQVPVTINNYASYNAYPLDTTQKEGLVNYSFTVSSPTGSVLSFGMTFNGTTTSSTSANGGTVQITVNGTNGQTLPFSYFINAVNNTNYTFNKNYNIVSYTGGQNGTFADIDAQLGTNISDGGKILLGVLITLAAMVAVSIFLSGYWLGIIGTLFLMLMVVIGFIPIGLGVLFGGLIIVEAFLRGGE